MTCFVQIFNIHHCLLKEKINKNKNISLPTLKLKNKSETDFFLGLIGVYTYITCAFSCLFQYHSSSLTKASVCTKP